MPTSHLVDEFLRSYQQAFGSFDAARIAGHFAYPAHVTSDAQDVVLTSVADAATWTKALERLLGTHRQAKVASARVVERTVAELSPRVCHATVAWSVHDADGRELYRFHATYTLVGHDGSLLVAALAHDELPRLQACLSEGPADGGRA